MTVFNGIIEGGGGSSGGGGTGDVVGPTLSTDNAVARFDSTTGKLLQDSVVTVSDVGVVAGASIDAAQLTGTVNNARLDTELQALGGLTSAANKGIQFTGAGTAATYDLTAAGKALLDDADAAAQLTTLGVSAFVQTVLDDADAAAVRTTIGAGTGAGTIGGSTGATDNRVLRSDGTGGSTVQNSAVTIDDAGAISGLTQLDVDSVRIDGTLVYTPSGSSIVIQNNSGLGYLQLDNNGATFDRKPLYNASVRVLAKTGAYTVVNSELLTAFTNEGTTARVDFTLPTAVGGYSYTFIVQDTDGVKIIASAGDTIRIGGSVSAAAGFVQSTVVGSSIIIVAINATEWIAINTPSGTWTIDS